MQFIILIPQEELRLQSGSSFAHHLRRCTHQTRGDIRVKVSSPYLTLLLAFSCFLRTNYGHVLLKPVSDDLSH